MIFGQKNTVLKNDDSLTDQYLGYSCCLGENGPLTKWGLKGQFSHKHQEIGLIA